jgi:hypothetical protein
VPTLGSQPLLYSSLPFPYVFFLCLFWQSGLAAHYARPKQSQLLLVRPHSAADSKFLVPVLPLTIHFVALFNDYKIFLTNKVVS